MMGGATGHTQVEEVLRRAIVAGASASLTDLGGERAVARDAAALARSCVFGDVVEIVLREWSLVEDKSTALAFFSDGIRSNERHDVLSHAVDALAQIPVADLRSVVRALDARVRDAAASTLLRAEAAAGLLRFALSDERWRPAAVASIQALDDVSDDYAGPMVCRLASLAYEHFHDQGCVDLLERLIKFPATAPQAAFERGMVQVGTALDEDDLPAISQSLQRAHAWFQKACDMAEDRRDAKAYLLLIELLVPVAEGRRIEDVTATERLREEVTIQLMWDRNAPGTNWLHPPRGAVLEWLPLADNLSRIADHLTEASWLDAGRILSDVVNVYSLTRAVRPALERVVRPAIEAAFVRERGLLAHLDQWLSYAGNERLDASDARALRDNIRRAAEPPPGNLSGAARTGRGASSKKSLPG